VWAGSAGLLAYATAYLLLNYLLPSESSALTVVSNVGVVLIEIALILLCWFAYQRGKGSAVRWIWVLVGVWAMGNLVGDGLWTYYEAIRGTDVPTPGPPDIGYLSAYVLSAAILSIVVWKTLDRFGAIESTLDAAIFTLGVAGLSWPLVLSPAFDQYVPSLGFWVDLAYPVLDLLLVFGSGAVFFGFTQSRRHERFRAAFSLICAAFLLQVVSDSAYFRLVHTGGEYAAGTWLDPLWVLSYALAGMAVLSGLRAQSSASADQRSEAASLPLAMTKPESPTWTTVVPYATLPVLAGMFAMQQTAGGLRWDRDALVLLFMGVGTVALLVTRQYAALVRNHRLYTDLAKVSVELEGKVADLADVNQRLADLNDSAHRLTSLRQSHAVARAGLEIACNFTKSPGGWISMGDGEDANVITWGFLGEFDPGNPEATGAAAMGGALRVLRLTIRDENLGTMWLLEPTSPGAEADLLPMISAQLASALDNAKRYEEALQLAERDPLTGLFNHRGIHRRLAGEALRAQQAGTELSLIMIDLDDFKVLNDTHGHAAGDSVLRQVSEAIRVVLRHADLAGRIGGDELLLVLPNTGSEGAMQLSERLRIALAARPYVTPGGHSIPVYLSLGVATLPEDAASVGQLLEVADAHLYASKQLGGNTTSGRGTATASDGEERGILGVAGRLLDAVGARDHYTRRHSEHVVHHALSLGEAVGLSEESLRTLHVAAMLHDVGKIGVPDELLRRPASLSPVDEQLVREHVLIGSDVILDMPRLAEVAAIVSSHHEQWDGLGYPHRSSGDDIPVLGRILAVADAYSAMTLDRPYRNSLTRAQAREELQRVSGSQLDPDLVRRFIEILDSQENRTPGERAAAS